MKLKAVLKKRIKTQTYGAGDVMEKCRYICSKTLIGIKKLKDDQSGVGVIEIVLILVILIGLVTVFKTQINDLLTRIFESITNSSNSIL